MAGLREQAVRLLRTKWRNAQPLAEELFLILLQAIEPETGPVNIDLGDGQGPIQVPPRQALDPFGQFQLPDLMLPPVDTTFDSPGPDGDWPDGYGPNVRIFNNPYYFFQEDPDEEAEDEREPPVHKRRRQKGTLERKTEVFPGKILSKEEDSTYTVEAYPFGLEGFNDGVNPVEGSGDTVTIAGVRQLQIADDETIPEGTWTLVHRLAVFRVTKTEEVETGPKLGGERVTTLGTNVELIHKEYTMQIPVWLR